MSIEISVAQLHTYAMNGLCLFWKHDEFSIKLEKNSTDNYHKCIQMRENNLLHSLLITADGRFFCI